MKKWTIFVAMMVSLATPMAAMAMDGSSGCGPGWFILKDNSLVSSALRAITNGVLFPVSTIGMTVGTSNCTQHKIVMTEQQSLHFATQNFYELKGEAARGEGAYLQAFAQTIGCGKSARVLFGQRLQSHYGEVFKETRRPEQMLENVYKVILSDDSLTRQCSLS